MIYLDNAATSFPKPAQVGPAMARLLANNAANPGRAAHRLAVGAAQLVDNVRLKLTRLFEGEDHQRMIFTMNCTDGLNMAIKGVLNDCPGAHVIATVVDHNSVSRPLTTLANVRQIELTRVDCDDQGIVDPDDIRSAIRPSTKLIVMTHASNVVGAVQDVAAVGAIAREHDALFLLDAAQSAGVVPISIKQMQIDLLAFAGHKSLLGPPGIGGLYVGQRANPRPWREGGTGGDSASPTQPDMYPYHMEGGSLNTVGIAGLDAAIDYFTERTMADILRHEQTLTQAVIERFTGHDRITIHGPRDPLRRTGALSFNIEGYESADVAAILDDSFDIAVRPGLHCAPYLHRRLNTFPNGTVRISPGPFNTQGELDTLLNAIEQIVG